MAIVIIQRQVKLEGEGGELFLCQGKSSYPLYWSHCLKTGPQGLTNLISRAV